MVFHERTDPEIAIANAKGAAVRGTVGIGTRSSDDFSFLFFPFLGPVCVVVICFLWTVITVIT